MKKKGTEIAFSMTKCAPKNPVLFLLNVELIPIVLDLPNTVGNSKSETSCWGATDLPGLQPATYNHDLTIVVLVLLTTMADLLLLKQLMKQSYH